MGEAAAAPEEGRGGRRGRGTAACGKRMMGRCRGGVQEEI